MNMRNTAATTSTLERHAVKRTKNYTCLLVGVVVVGLDHHVLVEPRANRHAHARRRVKGPPSNGPAEEEVPPVPSRHSRGHIGTVPVVVARPTEGFFRIGAARDVRARVHGKVVDVELVRGFDDWLKEHGVVLRGHGRHLGDVAPVPDETNVAVNTQCGATTHTQARARARNGRDARRGRRLGADFRNRHGAGEGKVVLYPVW